MSGSEVPKEYELQFKQLKGFVKQTKICGTCFSLFLGFCRLFCLSFVQVLFKFSNDFIRLLETISSLQVIWRRNRIVSWFLCSVPALVRERARVVIKGLTGPGKFLSSTSQQAILYMSLLKKLSRCWCLIVRLVTVGGHLKLCKKWQTSNILVRFLVKQLP